MQHNGPIIKYLLSQMSLVQEKAVFLGCCSTSCNYAGKRVGFESIKVILNAKNVSLPVQSSDCRLPQQKKEIIPDASGGPPWYRKKQHYLTREPLPFMDVSVVLAIMCVGTLP